METELLRWIFAAKPAFTVDMLEVGAAMEVVAVSEHVPWRLSWYSLSDIGYSSGDGGYGGGHDQEQRDGGCRGRCP